MVPTSLNRDTSMTSKKGGGAVPTPLPATWKANYKRDELLDIICRSGSSIAPL
jgi:hypothetical protein